MSPNPEACLELDRYARRILRRHKINERQRLLAEIVLDWSYAIGRRDAIIPRQQVFSLLTGISKGHVSDTLKSLQQAGIVLVNYRDCLYSFNVDATAWRCIDCRLRSPEQAAMADRVEAWLFELSRQNPAQIDLLPPPFDLGRALALDAFDDTLSQFVRPTDGGPSSTNTSRVGDDRGQQSSHPAPRDGGENGGEILSQAPSGLLSSSPDVPFPDGESLRQLMAKSMSQFPTREPSVPNSGTPHLDVLDGSNSSHLDGTKWPVPKLGTRPPFPDPSAWEAPKLAGGGTEPPRRPPVSAGSSGPSGRENELLDDIGRVLGTQAMQLYGGFWRKKIREDRRSVVEALEELKLRKASTRLRHLKSPGGYLRDRYNRFHAEAAGV